MRTSKPKSGYYTIINENKYLQPLDRHMNKELKPQYRSSWELIFYRYCDSNSTIAKWGVEPFPIEYISPIDLKKHRYYIDVFVEFTNGKKFLVGIKPYKETLQPKPPKTTSVRSEIRYQKEIKTYLVNKAKWEAARVFAASKGLEFIIITERELGL